MERQRDTQPDEGSDDRGEERGAGYTLSDPARRHITLENFIDLADLDRRPSNGQVQPAPPAEPRGWTVPARPARPARPAPAPAPPALPPPRPAPAAPHSAEPDALPPRARWARPAQRWLPEALAVAASSGAFIWPSVWLVTTAVVCVIGGCVAFVVSGHRVHALPWRAARRGVALLHPRSLVWAPVLAARTILVAVLLPGALAAASWSLDHGREGAIAAARAGAWTTGARIAVTLVCVMLLTSVGDGRYRRADVVRRRARSLADGALALLVLVCGVVAALVILVGPRPVDAVAASADGLGWLPAAARGPVDRARDDIVTTELDVVASCLSERGPTHWTTAYTSDNGLGDPDVARLLPADDSPSDIPIDLVTALLAVHNQLAPWVETIEVGLPNGEVIRTDRTELPSHEPLLASTPLVSATSEGRHWLLAVGPNVHTVLRCSAGAVL